MSQRPVEKRLGGAIFVLGFTSLVTQTILLREFLSVFSGNELVIGVVLGNWMVLTGTGAFLGRFSQRIRNTTALSITLLLLTAILPFTTVFLLRWLRTLVFPPGGLIGIVESAYSSFFLLVPYCLINGFLFSLMALIASERSGENRIAGVYSLESMGSILGGLVFNFAAVFLLTTFQSLILLGLPGLAVCAVLSKEYGSRLLTLGIAGLAVLFICLLFTFDIDGITRQRMFGGQQILYNKDTPYGNLTVTREGEQTSFFENGVLLFSTSDITANEEAVHYAMLQHPDPLSVLLISGGVSGIGVEVLKYGVVQIDYVEINPWLLEAGKRFTSALADRRIRAINEDARSYLHHCSEKYDVVLLNTPDPATAQINRYYTVEFFHDLAEHMNGEAVLCLSLLPAADYFGSDALLVSSSIYNTLRAEFGHVLIVPGNRNFFLASNRALNINIAHLIDARHIPTTYVNEDYIDDQLLGQRSEGIVKSLDPRVDLNRDFAPVAYYRQMRYWLSYFSFDPWIPAIVAGVMLLAVLFRLNAVNFGMLTGGFTASSVEVLLLISFQIMYGYVYQATGVIITVFMAGLAIGSWYDHEKLFPRGMISYAAIQGIICIYCMALPVSLAFLKGMNNDVAVYTGFVLLTMVIGVLVGTEFSMASKLQAGRISAAASSLYGVDLIGSAIGALIVAVYLLPLLGMTMSCVVVGLTSLLSASVSCVKSRQRAVRIEGGI